MRLTHSQIETFQRVKKELADRRIVLLVGDSNGKTFILQKLLHSFPPNSIDQFGPRRDSQLVACLPVYIGNYARITPQYVMRQVLTQLGFQPSRDAVSVAKAFNATLHKLRASRRSVALLVDNAEVLSGHAIAVLRSVNEITDRASQTPIGLGIALAGSTRLLKKLPSGFLDHCVQINLKRIRRSEISQFIESKYPGRFNRLGRILDRELESCSTTLQVNKLIERHINQCAEMRLDPESTAIQQLKIREAA